MKGGDNMSDRKNTYCFKFDLIHDADVIDVLESRFNRTEFIRVLIRDYLKRIEECSSGNWD